MSFSHSYPSRRASPDNFRYLPYPAPRSTDAGQGWTSRQPSYPPSRSSSSGSLQQGIGLELPPMRPGFGSQLASPPGQSPLLNLAHDDWQFNGPESQTLEPAPRNAALSGPISIADVERLAGRLGVCGNQLLQFNSLPESHKPIEIYGLLLQQQTEAAATRKALGDILNKISETKDSISQDFKPSKAAIKHMRRMTRHYLAQPLRSYYGVDSATKNYYMQRSPENHPLEVAAYPANAAVKNIIHKLLKEFAAQGRANLRKLVWRFVKERTQLSVWSNFMMQHYWFNVSGKTVSAPKMLEARLALMRQIALPLVDLRTTKGQNTNFWKLLNNELSRLYTIHGEATTSPGWDLWADEIIAKDKAAYKELPDGEIQAPEDDEDIPLDD